MFDIGWSEMLVIACLAIVVIGPKQLPAALRTVGYWIGRAKRMANEFQGHVDEMVAQSELDEVRQDVKSIANFDINDELNKSIELDGTSKADKAKDNGETAAADETADVTGLDEDGLDPNRFAPDNYPMAPANSIVPPVEDDSDEAPSVAEDPETVHASVDDIEDAEQALDIDHDDDEDDIVLEKTSKQEQAGP